ncbi:hypothetical protein AWJ20_569 [Sugiyamaella lignohabitans]|uniref:Ribosome biogenesis protein NSA1 n=1 Tax=Sugiyamaella lignohabitans TaxID=796027 RepID=A0A167D089_9ASCO|nr:uncharacterized protein AWJ20_569 [Sugiyamaella lignohabitans]ANB12319.1 hypothetical protein AWJ20_569 [Sugiyamaella lignohabitans]
MECRELVLQTIGHPGPHGMLRRMWHAKAARSSSWYTGRGSRVPVWISDIRFLDLDRPIGRGWKVAVGTKYGEIRIYDTAFSSRAIINVQVGPSPVTSLCYGLGSANSILYTNSQDTIGMINTRTGQFQQVNKCTPGTAWVCAAETGNYQQEVRDNRPSGHEQTDRVRGINHVTRSRVTRDATVDMDIDSEEEDKNDSDSSSSSSDGEVEEDIVGFNDYGAIEQEGGEESNFTLIDSLEPPSATSSVLPSPLETSTPVLSDSESRLVNASDTASQSTVTSAAIDGLSNETISLSPTFEPETATTTSLPEADITVDTVTTTTTSIITPQSATIAQDSNRQVTTSELENTTAPTPATTSVHLPTIPIYTTSGVDNCIRIYNMHTHKLIAKTTPGVRLSCISIIDALDPIYTRPAKRPSSPVPSVNSTSSTLLDRPPSPCGPDNSSSHTHRQPKRPRMT